VRHHTSMLETLKKFEGRFADRQLATLTASDITTWLATLKLAIKTRNRHLGYLRNAFGLAVTKFKILAANPLEKVDFFHDPAKNGRKIEILTPEEMTKFPSALDPDWLPFFAICAFTGLRSDEVGRLEWSEIKLNRLLIDLPFHKSKNGKRKLEEVPANLLAILSPLVRSEGPIKPAKKLSHAMTECPSCRRDYPLEAKLHPTLLLFVRGSAKRSRLDRLAGRPLDPDVTRSLSGGGHKGRIGAFLGNSGLSLRKNAKGPRCAGKYRAARNAPPAFSVHATNVSIVAASSPRILSMPRRYRRLPRLHSRPDVFLQLDSTSMSSEEYYLKHPNILLVTVTPAPIPASIRPHGFNAPEDGTRRYQ
jgi:hypothetical protein